MLSFVCFKWKPRQHYRSTFGPDQVNILAAMIGRHYHKPHRVVCVTDDPVGIRQDVQVIPLWNDFGDVPSPHGSDNPSCYRRLKMFSAEAEGMFGKRFVSIDLDCVIVNDITPLFDRDEDIVLWGDTNPLTPYNGSLILHTAGTRTKAWTDFNPKTSPALAKAKGFFGSDQAWLGACLGPSEAKWTTADGVYSFRNHIKPARGALPSNARITIWHGQHDPWTASSMCIPWVKKNYVADVS